MLRIAAVAACHMAAVLPLSLPIHKRELLARLSSNSGLMRVLRAFSASKRRLMILAYHRVLPAAHDENWPFDIELISSTPAEFRWQMQFVARHFRPVTVQQVAAAAAGGEPLPPRSVLVTFDDGFADNYQHAFPILRSIGMPACVFVSTDLVGTNRKFWFEIIAHLILRVPEGSSFELADGRTKTIAGPSSERRKIIRSLLAQLKSLTDAQRVLFVERFDEKFGRFGDSDASHLSRSLTWDEIREMAKGGIEFGSHGASHSILAKLSENELDGELTRSRDRLAAELQTKPLAIAYPVGGITAFNDTVVAACARAGYVIGMSYVPGANHIDCFDAFRLRRQHVERFTSRDYFNGLLSLPGIFH